VVLPLFRRGVLAPRDRVGLLPEDDRWFTIYFAQLPVARFDSHKLQVTPLPETGGCDPPAAHDEHPLITAHFLLSSLECADPKNAPIPFRTILETHTARNEQIPCRR
jgi:hypothetical protein